MLRIIGTSYQISYVLGRRGTSGIGIRASGSRARHSHVSAHHFFSRARQLFIDSGNCGEETYSVCAQHLTGFRQNPFVNGFSPTMEKEHRRVAADLSCILDPENDVECSLRNRACIEQLLCRCACRQARYSSGHTLRCPRRRLARFIDQCVLECAAGVAGQYTTSSGAL